MTDALTIAIWTTGWTVFGAIIGYMLGRFTRDIYRLAEDGERSGLRFNGRVGVAIIVVLLGLLTAVQGIATSQRTTQLQQCQASYANRFADALDARTQASNGSQRALDQLVTTLGPHVGGTTQADRAAVEQGIERYLNERRVAKQQRAKHPLPPPPREACQEGR